jgi:glycosyltransferase involved in cell wall biosynthesis
MRILWLSDRITGYSAYSKVTYEACARLVQMGHDVAHIPMGRANKMGKYYDKGVMLYPSGNDPWGEDVVLDHYLDWKADILITLKEPWVFNRIYQEAINFVPHAIIDHSPVSASITSRLKTAFKVIAVSRFGQRELRQNDVDSTYIPHGTRCDQFMPLDDKPKIRKMFYFDEDEFVVGIVAMNRSRKMIPHMLRGYKAFREMNPDVKSHLMLWTNIRPMMQLNEMPSGVSDVGVDLLPEIMRLELGEAVRWPEERVILRGIPDWAGPNYPDEWDMVKLYNTFNVLLSCTGGEAFGETLPEAQACGVPVLSTDYAAGPEQVGSGLTVTAHDYVVMNTPGTRYAIPDIDGIADALTKIMNANPEKLARKARRFAMNYDWPIIMERYWKPFLDEAEMELKPLVTAEAIKTWV